VVKVCKPTILTNTGTYINDVFAEIKQAILVTVDLINDVFLPTIHVVPSDLVAPVFK
jgi:hypothetical protein